MRLTATGRERAPASGVPTTATAAKPSWEIPARKGP